MRQVPADGGEGKWVEALRWFPAHVQDVFGLRKQRQTQDHLRGTQQKRAENACLSRDKLSILAFYWLPGARLTI